MSVARFVRYPIETNIDTLIAQCIAYIQARAPQWEPNDGSLDTWIIQALAALTAENRDLASDVPADIFRYFGSSIVGFPPIDAQSSTIPTTWTVIDTLGHTIPAGTTVVVTDAAGVQYAFETIVDTVISYGTNATAAGAVTLRSVSASAATAGLAGPGVTLQLYDVLDFVQSVVATDFSSGGVDAQTDDDYLDKLADYMRLLSKRPILPNDFAILGRSVAGVQRITIIDGYNPFHNLLTANQASAETDATGGAAAGNTTLASTSAQAADGTKSISLTATGAGAVGVSFPAAVPPAAGSVAVVPGDTVTGLASVRAAATARSVSLTLRWYTAAGASISTTVGTAANDSTSAWTNYTVTGIAPDTAAFVRLEVNITGLAAAEVHYTDKQSIRRNSLTDWVAGGTPETGKDRTITFAALDSLGNDVSAPIKAQITTLFNSNRELNFVVNSMNAVRSLVNITYTAKVLPGYVAATVKTNIEANLRAYLSATTWGVDATGSLSSWVDNRVVHYSDIAAIISNTEGVDYWSALTIGLQGGSMVTTDLTLPGPATLAVANTLTGTVT